MKTLKFMLAAATAIGLASATQADQYNTTGFEKLTAGDSVTTGVEDNRTGYSYFYYAGGTAADNESVIAEGTPNIARPRGASDVDTTCNNILQVSTGTDPLMRTYAPIAGGAPQNPTALEGTDVYVDTLVQFTVTPYTDTVTPSANDKLMIYLKESVTTNEFGEITDVTTNLAVIGGYYFGGTSAKEYGLYTDSVTVEPNTWHRLTVKAVCDLSGSEGLGFPGFQIWIDGVLCRLANSALTYNAEDDETLGLFETFEFFEDINAGKYVLSLLAQNGSQAASLQGVGFAGEGKVDDIVFSDLDPFATALDFTLTWGNGLSAVEYTITNTTFSLSGATSPATISVPIDYPAVTFTVANADGVQKTLSATASGSTTGIDATDTEFFWSDYLGEAVSGAYTIDDANDLVLLSKGVFSGLATSGETFKQTANIDMTGVADFYGIGWFDSSTSFASVPSGVKSDGKTALPFAGTYDGQGYTISNVTIVKHSYAGVFNNVSGTVKDLTVQDIGFSGTCTEWGCAIVGNASAGSLLENLTAVTSSGFNWGNSANHNVAGIVVRPIGAATIRGCVNNANISSVSKRLGGIASFVGSGTTGTVFDSCTNNATLVSTDGTRGVGGILGCAEGGVKNSPTANDTIIRNCADFGSETAQNANGHAGAIVGSNWNESYTYTDDGGNTFKAASSDCGYAKNAVFGRAYATASTISGTDYLTTVKAADLAAGNTYTLVADVAAGTVFTLQTVGDTIAFDSNGFTDAGTVAAAEGLTASYVTSAGVTTWTAANMAYAIVYLNDDGTPFTDWAANYTAPTNYTVADTVTLPTSSDVALQVVGVSFGGWTNETGTVTGWTAGEKSGAQTFYVKLDAVVAPAGWVDDPASVSNQTAATAYPALAGTALANADAQELTVWAKANSVAFNDATTTPGDYVEAFLLNCEPVAATVAAEKEAFVLDITVNADGSVTVSLPAGKSYNGTLQMKGSADLTTWTNVSETSSTYKFYKYELSL